MKAINIQWDTDNEMIDLPTEVEIPEDYSEDEVADYLSDEYGYCIFNFDIDAWLYYSVAVKRRLRYPLIGKLSDGTKTPVGFKETKLITK